MKTLIKYSIKHFGLVFLVLSAVVIWSAGCAGIVHDPDPLAGWHFYSRVKVPKAITDDYQDYIQQLPPEERNYVGDISFFEDGAGQHAVSIQIYAHDKPAYWRYALIYDKENRRIKVIKYDYSRYMS
jgi:hypothetical protein